MYKFTWAAFSHFSKGSLIFFFPMTHFTRQHLIKSFALLLVGFISVFSYDQTKTCAGMEGIIFTGKNQLRGICTPKPQ